MAKIPCPACDKLMDRLGTAEVVKFATALEQDGVIEGKYRDVEAGT